MPDTETTENTGTTDTSSEDALAQQLLADAVQSQSTDQGQSDANQDVQSGGLTNASADQLNKVIADLRKENAKWRTQFRDAEPYVKKAKELEEASKTESQRLAERADAAEKQLAEAMATNARLKAAAQHGIPAELVDLLGSGSEDEINARAELLAAKFAAAQPAAAPQPPASTRPVESLKSGGAPQSTKPADGNEWLRKLAGR